MTTTSDGPASTAFVSVWLPNGTDPVVAGRLEVEGGATTFTYGRTYLDRTDAIELFDLPLQRGPQRRPSGEMPLCIADAGPDGWGQRVIDNRRVSGGRSPGFDYGPLDYLLASSGQARIGALDVQPDLGSPSPPSGHGEALSATNEELASSAEKVEAGEPLSETLDSALLHGSSIGGARPKALLTDGSRRFIAKFSSLSDPYPVVQGEFAAMELARLVGLDVAAVTLASALGKDVLLVERFDRTDDGDRRMMVSAKTMLDLDEIEAWYATYWELANLVRRQFTAAAATLKELFSRITFNVLVGNTDEHARNHAAFWDGRDLSLTPAFDVCPQLRSGHAAFQAMAVGPDGFRASQVAGCVARASHYLLSEKEARSIVDHQIAVIEDQWEEVASLSRLAEAQTRAFWRRQILNPFALEGY